MRVALVGAVAVVACVLVAQATASDAQVKAAVLHERAALSSQKGTTLLSAMTSARASLNASAPASAKAKSARALALQAAAKGSLAANAQIASDKDNTAMNYGGATTQTALATKDLAAAKQLLAKALALL